jgi:coenzyme F420-reducing hydrogenase beta subunit
VVVKSRESYKGKTMKKSKYSDSQILAILKQAELQSGKNALCF